MRFKFLTILAAVVALWGSACSSRQIPERLTLTLGAYSTPREAFREINRDFKKHWRESRGEAIEIRESYLGSGAQSRAVVDGFPADIVALALEPDVERIQKAGLITHPWQEGPYSGMLTRTLVAFGVRKGNPKGIRDWSDLAREDVEVLSPNPRTSGGAMWNILAVFGAAQRGHVQGFSADQEGGKSFLKALLRRIVAMDKGARESILTFEKGLGDVALSYENEIKVGAAQSLGYPYELVLPSSTILIESPVAIVDKNVEQHGNRALVEAYRDYLYTPEAQRVFAKWGFRPVNLYVMKETGGIFATPSDLFSINDLGGWARVVPEFFGPQGLFVKQTEQAGKGEK